MIITNFVPCSIGKSALMAQPGLHNRFGRQTSCPVGRGPPATQPWVG